MAKTENNKETKKHVLIALSGMSPAVVTETVWAMARSQETSVVPDEVVVLTTKTGARKLREILQFDEELDEPSENGPWGELKKTLAEAGHNVKGKLIITGDTIKEFKGADRKSLDDLVTRMDNLQAANLMMQVIRDYTDDDDCMVHAQLAGGRKTMSALFFSCMCLLGRPCDHIYHVLVDAGYDNPKLDPPFLFPQKGVVHKGMKDGKPITLKSMDCRPNLFDVPFVPMGEWAEQKCKMNKRRRLSYENVIEAVSESFGAELFPKVVVDCVGKGVILLNGKELVHSSTNFLVLLLLLQGVGSEGVKNRIFNFKDDMAKKENRWEQMQEKVENSSCLWVNDVIWEVKRSPSRNGTESEEARIRQVFYYDDPQQNTDAFTKSKNAVKGALSKVQAPKLIRLFEQKADGALRGNFDYAAVEWRNVDRVPKFVREYIFPRDVPFPVEF